jgi:hypothetical protein
VFGSTTGSRIFLAITLPAAVIGVCVQHQADVRPIIVASVTTPSSSNTALMHDVAWVLLVLVCTASVIGYTQAVGNGALYFVVAVIAHATA